MMEHVCDGVKEPPGEKTAPHEGFKRGSSYSDLVKEANKGRTDDSHTNGGHTTVLEVISYPRSAEVNLIQRN
jgi:hypothetical protein